MTDRFDKSTLTRIISSGYPVEAKVAQIIALHELQRIHQLNEIANEIGHIIDTAKGNEL
ncbi:hypothetical protein ACRPK0_07265 [Limosilactobacillus reuteri]|uniref:hypothetical protein n=1 Tax=Limosilactobacillus reuteri TaxID=1598 RepID=UPI003D7791D1